jgi:hypothetical protein
MSIETELIYPESEYAKASTACVFLYHGEQLNGEVQNLVVGGPAAVKAAGITDADLWETVPGVMSFTGAAQFVEAPSQGTQVTLDGQSLIVTARIKKKLAAHVGSTRYLLGNYKPGTTSGGFVVSVTTNGAAGLTVSAAGGGAGINNFAPSGTITDGTTATEKHLVWVTSRDGFGRSAVDGVQAGTTTIASAAGINLQGGNPFYMGSQIEGFELTHVGAYQVPLDLADIPLALLFDWSYRHPGAMIPDWVFGL